MHSVNVNETDMQLDSRAFIFILTFSILFKIGRKTGDYKWFVCKVDPIYRANLPGWLYIYIMIYIVAPRKTRKGFCEKRCARAYILT